MPCSIQYHFVQRFKVGAKKAYEWCTDYEASDHFLMGEKEAERKISHLANNIVILTDVFHIGGEQIEKQKLVHLYPSDLKWVSTHLAGPIKYSQFVYEISEEGKNASRLNFTGVCVDYGRDVLDNVSYKLIAKRLCKEDSHVWRLLAKAMNQDLLKSR